MNIPFVDGYYDVLALQNLHSRKTASLCVVLDLFVAMLLQRVEKIMAEDHGPMPFPFEDKSTVAVDRFVIQPTSVWL